MSDNWVVQNLQNALETWNSKFAEIWTLLTQSPEPFKGGAIWQVILSIHGALQSIIVLACIIFSVFASSPHTVDTSAAAVTQVWSYVGELIFNMPVLVGSVKMADRIVREMMGL